LPLLTEAADPALELEVREMGQRCNQGMLLCLDVDGRAAFVLGEVFDFDACAAAQVPDIGEAAFRQRLSRARRQLEAFMGSKCALVSSRALCNCRNQSRAARAAGLAWPQQFSRPRDGASVDLPAVMASARGELSRLQRIGPIYRTHPEWRVPEELADRVREVLQTSARFDKRPLRLS
jgi:hypothetical protein